MPTIRALTPPTAEELAAALNNTRCRLVECAVGDFTSVARGKMVHRDDFVAMAGCKLPSVVLGLTLTAGEPEAVFGPILPTDYSDMRLVPDLATLVARPGRDDEYTVLCEPAGTLELPDRSVEVAALSPRAALRSVLRQMDAAGYTALAAPELEFFLLGREAASAPREHTWGSAVARGSLSRERSCEAYSLERATHFDAYFDELYEACDVLRIPINGHAHEAAMSQYEVNFRPGEPLAQADAVFRFKRLAREVAARHGFLASFAPKPFLDQPGVGTHWHFSLQAKDKSLAWPHVFGDASGATQPALRHFIAGLQRHAPAAMALFAPHDMAYDRIALSDASPSHASWGEESRALAFRIPASSGRNRRVENRLPGGDANPYLTVAATLGLGLLGLREGKEPTAGTELPLPTTLPEALAALQASAALREVLGGTLVAAYAAIKAHEHAERSACVDPRAEWDLPHLIELA